MAESRDETRSCGLTIRAYQPDRASLTAGHRHLLDQQKSPPLGGLFVLAT
jgi:hypothetical protein